MAFLSPPPSYYFLEDGYEIDLASGEIIGEGTHQGPPSDQVLRVWDFRAKKILDDNAKTE